MLNILGARARRKRIAAQLCASVSARAREPAFYRDIGVADSFDGRFDLLALHAWLVLERLRIARESALAQAFVDALFARLDEALREQGAGDIGMGRRMKKLVSALYGRLDAYSKAADDARLAEALLRNVYRGDVGRVEDAARLATYVRDARNSLALCHLDGGDVEFGPLPVAEICHDGRHSHRTPS
ncbi:MAG: ubiquinol-cytochrome C chaperone family protein [Rhizomicrobium sp.]